MLYQNNIEPWPPNRGTYRTVPSVYRATPSIHTETSRQPVKIKVRFYIFFTVLVKWSDIRPSMVTHTQNLCSAFDPSKVCTHSSEHTHTVNTHPEQPFMLWQLGVRCLAQGHLSRGIEGGESAVHSLPQPTIPAGPETRTHNLSITSPTL